MKILFFIMLSLNSKSQTPLLNVTGTFAKDSVPIKFKHLSGRVVNGKTSDYGDYSKQRDLYYSKPSLLVSRLTDNGNHLQVEGKRTQPFIITIDSVEYLIFNKKIYILLK